MTVLTPLVSIVIPVFNGQKYLREAIKSMLNQTYSSFELILVDDFSQDSSAEIIDSFTDSRIVYLKNNANIGIGLSRKRGILAAKGKYVALLDQDDVSYPDRLQQQVAFMEKHPNIGASSGHADIIDERGELTGNRIEAAIGKKLEPELIFQYVFNNPASIYRRDAIIKAGNFRDEYCEDYSLLIRIVQHHKIANLPKSLIKYRIHGKNTSITQVDKMLEGEKKCINMILEFLDIERNDDFTNQIYNMKPGKILDQHIGIEHYHKILLLIFQKNSAKRLFDTKSLKRTLSRKWKEVNILHNKPSLWFFFTSPLFSIKKFHFRDLNILLKKCKMII